MFSVNVAYVEEVTHLKHHFGMFPEELAFAKVTIELLILVKLVPEIVIKTLSVVVSWVIGCDVNISRRIPFHFALRTLRLFTLSTIPLSDTQLSPSAMSYTDYPLIRVRVSTFNIRYVSTLIIPSYESINAGRNFVFGASFLGVAVSP